MPASSSAKPHSFLLRLGRAVLLGYAATLVLVAGCQNRLIYFPARGPEEDFIARGARLGMKPWRDADGRLVGWHRPNPRAANRMVIFHGNAGSALDRDYYPDAFEQLGGGAEWEVWLFEYPGYGPRPGSPGKSAFIPAGRAAVEELLTADSRPLFVLGESIGSGTACVLAGAMTDRIAGLLLVTPFASLAEVAREKFRLLPTGLLLREKFDNVAALQGYRGKVAVVVAAQDEVVGAAQGRKLHSGYPGSKLLIVLEGAGHNTIDVQPDADWFRKVSTFLLGR